MEFHSHAVRCAALFMPASLHQPTDRRRRHPWYVIPLIVCALCLPSSMALAAVKVTLLGLNTAQRDNVRLFLGLKDSASTPSETYLRRLFSQAPQEIRTALRALGYYQPEIDSDLAQHGQDWEARFTVKPGTPVRVTVLDIAIDTPPQQPDSAFAKLLADFPLHKGDVLNHGRYDQAKHDWRVLADERGYFDAHFTDHRIEVDVEHNSAAIHLHYILGERYRLGAVSFAQQGYDTDYLARFVPFTPDTPYDTRHLLELRTRLENSDHFASVEVNAPHKAAKDHVIPVQVTLTNRPKYKFTSGIGYGTDTGPRLTLGWENRRVNSAGHRFTSAVSLSGIGSNATALYSIPLRDPSREHLDFLASHLTVNTSTVDSRTTLLGVRRTKVRHVDWLETVYLNAQREAFQVGADSGKSTLLLPGINWTRTRKRAGAYLVSGDRLYFELRGTDTWLGSDTRFVQAIAKGKLIKALNKDSRVLLRMDFGASEVGTFSELPASQRFFAGGDQSVRGYAYNSLGPKDSTGAVVGGRYLMVGSLEYERRVFDKWSVALFYDVGNATDGFTDPLMHGAGIGVRWQTPIGPVRLDLASALDKPGHPLRLHLFFGPDL